MVSFSFPVAMMALFAASAVHAESSVQRRTKDESFRVLGYTTDSQVTDHAALDLDQMRLNEQAAKRKIYNAKKVYEEGGHSFSYAELNLKNLTSSERFDEGTEVVGVTSHDPPVNVTGRLMEVINLSPGDTVVAKVQYDTSDIQSDYVDCQVGGLYTFGEANHGGCFTPSGSVTFIDDNDKEKGPFDYEYDKRSDNKNLRTLQSLSKDAAKYMKGYREFQLFVDYYGDEEYADKWFMAAFNGESTNFSKKRGNADFKKIKEHRPGRAEAMKKGSAYLNVWMWVVKEMNDAITKCKDNEDNASHSIDKAVAFYAGSLTVTERNEGIMLYALADVRAHQFRTSGHSDEKEEGEAFINIQIGREFRTAQSLLKSDDKDRCQKAEESVNKIINYMKVPLVQGVLRYAYVRNKETPPGEMDKERAKAEGATFAAAVLPFIHKCNIKDADTIHQHMRVGENDKLVDFQTVKTTLERNYGCLGITCEEVGGVWDGGFEDYKEGAAPCTHTSSSSSSSSLTKSTGSTVGSVLGITIGVLLLGWLFIRYRHMGQGIGKGFRKRKNSQHTSYNGNIAAVTEIA